LYPAAEEPWSWFCFRRGAAGAEWREESPARLRIAYFFDQLEERTPERWLEAFRADFPAAPPPVRIALVERLRERWETAWRAHFAPVPVAKTILLCPPWAFPGPAPTQGTRRPLVIEPGQGFGTGHHASTVLALELLEDWLLAEPIPENVPDCIVDVGTGSGILAIAARLLGVRRAVVLDTDRRVMPEVARNFRLNGLNPPLCVLGGVECLRGGFPLVLANLMMPLLRMVSPRLAALIARGGVLIVSGVLATERAQLVTSYLAQDLHPREARSREGWLACRFDRPS
jgi:ribosomal protein L11 methyltransferase